MNLQFDKKRDYKLITPCCHKSNKNGKFVNYKYYPKIYGYCHSCGKSSLPPSLYIDEDGNYFTWNTVTNRFEGASLTSIKANHEENTNSNSMYDKNGKACLTSDTENDYLSYKNSENCRTIDFKAVETSYKPIKSNNFISFLNKYYDTNAVDVAIEMYYIGTSKYNWTVFWYINSKGEAQKSKEVLYKTNGKRTNKFRVPYKNDAGYFFCLYGEHLLQDNTKPIVLVESEKTAIVCSIQFPSYTWLAYSGINGLTDDKLHALRNKQIVIAPDMSNNAVNIIRSKKKKFDALNIEYRILDLTYGKTDQELKDLGWYNADIEDIIREDFS